MKKTIYLSVLAALALTACDNDADRVFDKSAADRLEQYKEDYANVLTADGGLWTMEYFSNDEEPGYVFIMKFDKDGSVKIGANHKWIGNTYKEETSLWKMIADNGPVLSFNSYNTLFHIFSDPADITGTDRPMGENDTEINETGYGHNGDYEFQVMEVADNGNVIRLLGKKRMIDIYLRRLDETTDMKAYMDEYKQLGSTLFAKEIPNLKFTDSDGETYMVNGCDTGIMSIYPEDGDAVTQTRSGNFIITNTGIRFMEPLEYLNAAGEEKTLSEFTFTGNRSLALVGGEDAVLSAGDFNEILMRNMRNWKVDLQNLGGEIKSGMDAFNEELKTLYKYRQANVLDMAFDFDYAENAYFLRLNVRISQKGTEKYLFPVSFNVTDGGVMVKIGEAVDETTALAYKAYPALQEFFRILQTPSFEYSSDSDCGPKVLNLEYSDDKFVMTAI